MKEITKLAMTLFIILILSSCSGGDKSKSDATQQDTLPDQPVDITAEDAGREEQLLPDTTELPTHEVDIMEETTDDTEEVMDASDVQDTGEQEIECPTFADVVPIFQMRCATCHPSIDFTSYSEVSARINEIKNKVEMGHHIGGEDQETILTWIDCGYPE